MAGNCLAISVDKVLYYTERDRESDVKIIHTYMSAS